MEIYCGNNSLNGGLRNGTKRMGTRYECFRKGVGIGLNKPLTGDEDAEYSPIYNEGLFCGNGNRKPRGYKKLGQPFQCLRKGVGVGTGLKIAREEGEEYSFSFGNYRRNYTKVLLVFIIMFVLVSVILILTKPKFALKDTEKKTLNLNKIGIVGLLVGVLSSFLYFLV